MFYLTLPPHPLPLLDIQVTLGPKGRNALIDQSFGAPKITKVRDIYSKVE